MEKIATDTFSFEDLRTGGFVYVDKTAILKRLVDGSIGKQFFIARPYRTEGVSGQRGPTGLLLVGGSGGWKGGGSMTEEQ